MNEGKRGNVNAKLRINPTRTSVMETSSTYVFSYINYAQIYVYRERYKLHSDICVERERQCQRECRLTIKCTYCTDVC